MQPEKETAERKTTVAEFVTNRIVQELSNGVEPWRQPWFSPGKRNLVRSENPYSTLNNALLAAYSKPDMFFVTEKDVKNLHGELKSDATPACITFWKNQVIKVDDPEKKKDSRVFRGKDGNFYYKLLVLRRYNVFGVSEVDDPSGNIKKKQDEFASDTSKMHSDLDDICERLKSKGLRIEVGSAPSFNHLTGTVIQPSRESMRSTESYYETLFHNIMAWVREKEGTPATRKPRYEKFDELVNELGALILMSMYGVPREQNSTAYIKKWLDALEENPNHLIFITSWAEKAVQLIEKLAYA